VSSPGISKPFGLLSRRARQVIHVLLTRPPLTPKGPLDLHVLGTPPAFVLSQDQTLRKKFESALVVSVRLARFFSTHFTV
jgi:hypothetical protein